MTWILHRNSLPKGQRGKEIRERFEREEVCSRCGECCFQGYFLGNRHVLIHELPCVYLVKTGDGTTSCKEYKRRHEIPWCNFVNYRTVKRGLFPPDCTYIQGIPNYNGKKESSPEEWGKVKRVLKKRMKNYPCPEYIRPQDWLLFLKSLS